MFSYCLLGPCVISASSAKDEENDQRSSCCGEAGRASAGLERELGGFGVLMKTSYWGLALRAVYASSE